MKIILHITIVLILIFGTLSCVSDPGDVDIPKFDQKLVIQTVISPGDSVINAYLGYNYPAYGEIVKENILNAGVKLYLSDGKNEEMFIQNSDTFSLKLKSFQIIEGNSYSIRATDNKGHTISAECIMPVARNINMKIDTLTVVENSEYGTYSQLNVNTKFTDYKGEENYYILQTGVQSYYFDTYYQTELSNTYFLSTNYISDKSKDGLLFSETTVINKDAYYADSLFIYVSIEQTTKDYYLFLKSLQNYSDGDDPFSEVVPVYTNIEGGLGIFGGFVTQTYNLRLK